MKSPMLLLQYWKNNKFDTAPKTIWVHQYHFCLLYLASQVNQTPKNGEFKNYPGLKPVLLLHYPFLLPSFFRREVINRIDLKFTQKTVNILNFSLLLPVSTLSIQTTDVVFLVCYHVLCYIGNEQKLNGCISERNFAKEIEPLAYCQVFSSNFM